MTTWTRSGLRPGRRPGSRCRGWRGRHGSPDHPEPALRRRGAVGPKSRAAPGNDRQEVGGAQASCLRAGGGAAAGAEQTDGRRTGGRLRRPANQTRITGRASACSRGRARPRVALEHSRQQPDGGQTSVWTADGRWRTGPRVWPGLGSRTSGPRFGAVSASGRNRRVAGGSAGQPACPQRFGVADEPVPASEVAGPTSRRVVAARRRFGAARWRPPAGSSPDGAVATNQRDERVSTRESRWGRVTEVAGPARRQGRGTGLRLGVVRCSGSVVASPAGLIAERGVADGSRPGRGTVRGGRGRETDTMAATAADPCFGTRTRPARLARRPSERPRRAQRSEQASASTRRWVAAVEVAEPAVQSRRDATAHFGGPARH